MSPLPMPGVMPLVVSSQATTAVSSHQTQLSNAASNTFQTPTAQAMGRNNNNTTNNNNNSKNNNNNYNNISKSLNELKKKSDNKKECCKIEMSTALTSSLTQSPSSSPSSSSSSSSTSSSVSASTSTSISTSTKLINKKSNTNNATNVQQQLSAQQLNEINVKSEVIPESKTQTDAQAQVRNQQSSSSENEILNTTDIKIESEDPLEGNDVVTSSSNTTNSENKPASSDGIMFARPHPVYLNSVNPHITCNLCYGYLIDATTIVECLHSFCHSCLIKHLRTEQYCPRCEMMINTVKPNIKSDTTLQAIVYKLVPGLYERELIRKRTFFKDRPEEAALATPEQRGDDTEHLIFSPSDYMSLSLEYADIDEHIGSNSHYSELLKPRYLQCPAMYTVGHLKKFVYGKFDIDIHSFNIDIMFKVKTIVLLDHYTLMDVAYIYTWKRDAPMRFYFRVKESLKPIIKVRKPSQLNVELEHPVPKTENDSECETPLLRYDAMTIIHEQTPSLSANDSQILEPTEIKVEDEIKEEDNIASSEETPTSSQQVKEKEDNVLPSSSSSDSVQDKGLKLKSLKIVLPSNNDKQKTMLAGKNSKDKEKSSSLNSKLAGATKSSNKEKKDGSAVVLEQRDERKVENIKLKIDLSKQNSVTIIKMSDPRKEVVKLVKSEKEWKVKNKKEKESSPKSVQNGDRKGKIPSPLTVPPLTIKAERISLLTKTSTVSSSSSKVQNSPSTSTSSKVATPSAVTTNLSNSDDEKKKSQFLKSFSLAPIKSLIKTELAQQALSVSATSTSASMSTTTSRPLALPSVLASSAATSSLTNQTKTFATSKKDGAKVSFSMSLKTPPTASKRKSKEPMKTVAKKPKLSSPPPTMNDFKIKLTSVPNNSMNSNTTVTSKSSPIPPSTTSASTTTAAKEKSIMPRPALSIMRPPTALPKKSHKPQSNPRFAAPGSLTPHPSNSCVQFATPGNRTPIAKRYQPILPKAARPNPFANIPNDVNKLLKDAGTEIKSIANETNMSKVYGPKTESSNLMGPPPAPKSQSSNSLIVAQTNTSHHRSNTVSNTSAKTNANASCKTTNSSKTSATNNYLNLALFNSSKSKGNEAPPGCRTPMYSPNSPIYSPSSPQYIPNYKISTVPTYKYTPKPANINSSYLQNMFNSSSPMANLFPAPPTKKDNNTSPSRQANTINSQQPQKRVYPFARSPSPDEDPPEKQLKVKSLLNSCNISIPSSLSITITREDSESQSNSTAYPKHKSPVNNYIEILKLPDQTAENIEYSKRMSPPVSSALKIERENSSGNQHLLSQKGQGLLASGHNMNHKMTAVASASVGLTKSLSDISKTNTKAAATNQSSMKTAQNDATVINNAALGLKNNIKASQNSQMKPAVYAGLSSGTSTSTTTTTTTTTKSQEHKPQLQQQQQQQNQNSKYADKKTPSPEKRPTAGTATAAAPPSTCDNNKSPKTSPNADAAAIAQAAKKFRHILPRQNPIPIPEVIPPKVTTANIIGTYSSPSGVAVKIHANKKISPPMKKSPNAAASPASPKLPQELSKTQGRNNSNSIKSLPNLTAALKQTSNPSKSLQSPVPVAANNNSNNFADSAAKGAKTPTRTTAATVTALPPTPQPTLPPQNAAFKNLLPHALSAIPNLAHSMQSANLAGLPNMPSHVAAAAANAAGQAEMSKFLKENLLRAQVQAAAANSSNMFYSYANAAVAAQMSQYSHTPSLYHTSYQQAYIMEQLTRLRAGSEAYSEYMQKIKTDREKLALPTTTALPSSSPKAATTQPKQPPPPPTPLPTSNSSSSSNHATITTSTNNTTTTTTTSSSSSSSSASKGGNAISSKTK